MRIFVTGATGFLGRHLVRDLSERGHEVSALRRSRTIIDDPIQTEARVTWHALGDIDLEARNGGVLSGIDSVVNCAGNYGRPDNSISKQLDANLLFPLKVMTLARTAGVKTFINTDTALPRHFNAYALTKAQFSDWGRMFALSGELSFVNVRLEHMFGPGDSPSKFTEHVIDSCANHARKLDLTPGEQLRDFIYISDVVNAYATLIAHCGNDLKGFHDVPLGSGTSTRIRDFVELVHLLARSRTKLNFGALPYRRDEVMLSVANTHLLEEFGWKCGTSLREGIESTLRSKAR